MSSRERMTKVLGCLVLSVTAGALLLKLLQPDPLLNVTAFSLSAAFTPIQRVFETRVPVDGARWQYILIYQSGLMSGNAQTIAESYRQERRQELPYHFVINNGYGAPDGRIQVSQRWVEQKPDSPYAVGQAGTVPGATIKICLIGDFSTAGPKPTQMRQLQALLKSLQQQCQIPSENIFLSSSGKLGKNQWRLFPLNEIQ
ncbi:MAG: hypothetical protein GWP14_02885 [Actinobacteria bacterium]|nr:hypothetical protein [Actinomycetota bacterium]